MIDQTSNTVVTKILVFRLSQEMFWSSSPFEKKLANLNEVDAIPCLQNLQASWVCAAPQDLRQTVI